MQLKLYPQFHPQALLEVVPGQNEESFIAIQLIAGPFLEQTIEWQSIIVTNEINTFISKIHGLILSANLEAQPQFAFESTSYDISLELDTGQLIEDRFYARGKSNSNVLLSEIFVFAEKFTKNTSVSEYMRTLLRTLA